MSSHAPESRSGIMLRRQKTNHDIETTRNPSRVVIFVECSRLPYHVTKPTVAVMAVPNSSVHQSLSPNV